MPPNTSPNAVMPPKSVDQNLASSSVSDRFAIDVYALSLEGQRLAQACILIVLSPSLLNEVERSFAGAVSHRDALHLVRLLQYVQCAVDLILRVLHQVQAAEE